MRAVWLTVVAGCLAVQLSGATIGFQVTPLGSGMFRYTYSLNSFTFAANEGFDIRFASAQYSSLTNPVAPSGWSAQVLQPNNPPGAAGDYLAVAQVNNATTAGPFSVDFTFLAAPPPGSQPFSVFQASGTTTGTTIPANNQSGVPEPSTLSLVLAGGLLCAVSFVLRRNQHKSA